MHFVILGAGPAGLQAASEALALGQEVTLLDPEGLGGNGLRHSLVPSKTLIRAADAIQDVDHLGGSWSRHDWPRIMGWQHQLVEAGIRRAEAFLGGAHVIHEAGRLADPHTVISARTGVRLVADVVIVATGSRQRVLSGMKPDGERVLMPRLFHELTRLPREIAIVGAGATGLEAASLFSGFGVLVHLYIDSPTLLPTLSRAIGARLTERLNAASVEIHCDRRVHALAPAGTGGVQIAWTSSVGSGRDVRPRVLLAVGREPVWEREGLDRLGFQLDGSGFFRVDEHGRTNIPGVYAIGDAAGEPLLANKAWGQGWRAVSHALGRAPTTPFGPPVHAVYTRPEIAWVGEKSAFYYGGVLHAPWLYASLFEEPPYLLLYTDDAERLVGGEAIGGGAADAMSTLGLAISSGLTLADLRSFQPASPTPIEWLATVARGVRRHF